MYGWGEVRHFFCRFTRLLDPFFLLEVVPDGFGVAYMTGYDGDFLLPIFPILLLKKTWLDRLQYTVTSRKEMPNAKFTQEISLAADDLYALHAEISATKAKL